MKLRVLSSLMVALSTLTGCGLTGGYNLPPASQLLEPGPGVGGPGPGVLSMPNPMVAPASYTGMPAGPPLANPVSNQKVQVLFARPEAMQVAFDASGGGGFDSVPVITPARQNFFQGGIYRLKVTGIPGREGTELYPTLEIGPTSRRTAAYLAHNAIPVQFTEEDFDQVLSGNFVTKVIYLPDPEFQELALAGVETLVSTRLDPGLDPIREADRRGAILAVLRVGNKDMEVPGTEEVLGSLPESAQGVTTAVYSGEAGVAPANYDSLGGIVADAGSGMAVGIPQGAPMVGGYAEGCPDGSCVGSGMPGGGLHAGLMTPGAAGFYGPNSTPRGGYGPGGLPPGLAGAGQYGMPITGTPIGLPGPPHIPLGTPAGLKKHVIHNWTKQHIPDPVSTMKINVKQRPGISYPTPPSRAWVVEDTIHSQPHYSNRHFGVPASGAANIDAGGGYSGGVVGGGHGGLLQGMKGMFGGLHH